MAADQIEPFADGVRDWIDEEGLADALTTGERELVAKRLDGWEGQELANAAWLTESIGVLLWALGFVAGLPPYDEQFHGLHELVPLLESSEDFRKHSRLRQHGELARAREVAELWHWRSRTTQLSNDADFRRSRPEVQLDDIVKAVAGKAHAAGDMPEPIHNDFPAFGKAYGELDATEYSHATSIAMERHHALNWLCGHGERWDRTPTDT